MPHSPDKLDQYADMKCKRGSTHMPLVQLIENQQRLKLQYCQMYENEHNNVRRRTKPCYKYHQLIKYSIFNHPLILF